MIAIFFYLFAVDPAGLGRHGGERAQPGAFGAVPDSVFFNAAALFLIAGAEFLAMILVIVYVGAVAVLFLFVVMMLDIEFRRAARRASSAMLPVGALVGARAVRRTRAGRLGGWRFAPGAPPLRLSPTPTDISNTQALGRLIYTDTCSCSRLAGLILLVAMIGAIVLTLRDRKLAAPEHRRPDHARSAETWRS